MELTRHLFYTTHKYVVLGKFTTDKLEKAFSKLRQGSGGTYFITVQQILEKVNIQKTKLLLNCTSMENLHTELGHMCLQCSYRLDGQGSELFDNLVQLENSLTISTKTALVYIAGYVTRKDEELPEKDLLEVTTFYFEKYGSYTDELDRGQFNIPTDSACQYNAICYMLYNVPYNQRQCMQGIIKQYFINGSRTIFIWYVIKPCENTIKYFHQQLL